MKGNLLNMIPVAAMAIIAVPLAVASAGTTDKTDCLASAVDPMIGTDFTEIGRAHV